MQTTHETHPEAASGASIALQELMRMVFFLKDGDLSFIEYELGGRFEKFEALTYLTREPTSGPQTFRVLADGTRVSDRLRHLSRGRGRGRIRQVIGAERCQPNSPHPPDGLHGLGALGR